MASRFICLHVKKHNMANKINRVNRPYESIDQSNMDNEMALRDRDEFHHSKKNKSKYKSKCKKHQPKFNYKPNFKLLISKLNSIEFPKSNELFTFERTLAPKTRFYSFDLSFLKIPFDLRFLPPLLSFGIRFRPFSFSFYKKCLSINYTRRSSLHSPLGL